MATTKKVGGARFESIALEALDSFEPHGLNRAMSNRSAIAVITMLTLARSGSAEVER